MMEKGKETIEGDKLSGSKPHMQGCWGKEEIKLTEGVQFTLNKCSQNAKDAELHKNHMSGWLK